MDIEMNLHDRIYHTEHSIPQGRKLSRLLLLKQRTTNWALI